MSEWLAEIGMSECASREALAENERVRPGRSSRVTARVLSRPHAADGHRRRMARPRARAHTHTHTHTHTHDRYDAGVYESFLAPVQAEVCPSPAGPEPARCDAISSWGDRAGPLRRSVAPTRKMTRQPPVHAFPSRGATRARRLTLMYGSVLCIRATRARRLSGAGPVPCATQPAEPCPAAEARAQPEAAETAPAPHRQRRQPPPRTGSGDEPAALTCGGGAAEGPCVARLRKEAAGEAREGGRVGGAGQVAQLRAVLRNC